MMRFWCRVELAVQISAVLVLVLAEIIVLTPLALGLVRSAGGALRLVGIEVSP